MPAARCVPLITNKKQHSFRQVIDIMFFACCRFCWTGLACDETRVFCTLLCSPQWRYIIRISEPFIVFFHDFECIKIIASPCVCLSIGLIILFEISAHSTYIIWKIMLLAAVQIERESLNSAHMHMYGVYFAAAAHFSVLSLSMDSLWMAYVISAFIRASSRLRLVNCQFVFDITAGSHISMSAFFRCCCCKVLCWFVNHFDSIAIWMRETLRESYGKIGCKL